jgi:putative oxidoreductase
MLSISILGRIIFGAYFVYSGIHHFTGEKMLIGYAKAKGVAYPRVAVLLTGVMLVVGGLGVLLNYNLQASAVLLLVFMVPTTFMMHNFWKAGDAAHKMNDHIAFMKNIALIGALLMMLM